MAAIEASSLGRIHALQFAGEVADERGDHAAAAAAYRMAALECEAAAMAANSAAMHLEKAFYLERLDKASCAALEAAVASAPPPPLRPRSSAGAVAGVARATLPGLYATIEQRSNEAERAQASTSAAAAVAATGRMPTSSRSSAAPLAVGSRSVAPHESGRTRLAV
eukprot:c22281_g1_i1.p1 GENE.c22281_g1_i1~~c22281_g1_i1.p1  ORF type:complete len:186 (+),score=23.95 c22281_g1_i1:61-558(+)